MAQPSARPEFSNLTLRILSAAVLLPLVVVVVWFGSWYFLTFVVLIGAAMGLEYSKLCGAGAIARGFITGALATLPVMLFLAGPFAGLAWGAVCAILLMFYILIRRSSDGVLLLNRDSLSFPWNPGDFLAPTGAGRWCAYGLLDIRGCRRDRCWRVFRRARYRGP